MFFDLLGAIASLCSTYYFIRRDKKAWTIGIIATCMNTWLYWQKGIYADMCLESFYLLSACYGWYRWSQKPSTHESEVLAKVSSTQVIYILLFISILFEIIFHLLTTYSTSNIASLDALTTAISITAQWLMCQKLLATWALWFITDSLYAVMYAQKDLPFHALLMLIYTGMAVIGYLSWIKQIEMERN